MRRHKDSNEVDQKLAEAFSRALSSLKEVAASDKRFLDFFNSCELFSAQNVSDLPLRYLEDAAYVSDLPCRKIIPRDRQQRLGRFPYHTRGFQVEMIDDYSIEGQHLLVGCLGTLETPQHRLVVAACKEKETPSELFHVVLPFDKEEFDYLFHVLSNTISLPLMEGTDIAQTLPIERLKTALIPWPKREMRLLFSKVLSHLDTLEAPYANLPFDQYVDLRKAIIDTRLAIGSLFLACTHKPENLARPKQKSAVLPTATFLPPLSRNETTVDATEQVLDIVSALIDMNMDSESSPLDVVSATTNLEQSGVGKQSSLCVCMPSPNQKDWAEYALDEKDSRWVLGVPPRNKANYAWIMQTIDAMNNEGVGILLLCNGPLVSSVGTEKSLRSNLATSGLVQCVISLPGQLFADNRPPSSLLVLEKSIEPRSETLFIDAQTLGIAQENGLRALTQNVVERIGTTYAAWKTKIGYSPCEGFSKSITQDQIAAQNYLLAPWAYV